MKNYPGKEAWGKKFAIVVKTSNNNNLVNNSQLVCWVTFSSHRWKVLTPTDP